MCVCGHEGVAPVKFEFFFLPFAVELRAKTEMRERGAAVLLRSIGVYPEAAPGA